MPDGSLVNDGELGKLIPVDETATLTPLIQECRIMSSLPRLENILFEFVFSAVAPLLGGQSQGRPLQRSGTLQSVQYRQSRLASKPQTDPQQTTLSTSLD